MLCPKNCPSPTATLLSPTKDLRLSRDPIVVDPTHNSSGVALGVSGFHLNQEEVQGIAHTIQSLSSVSPAPVDPAHG